MGLPCEKPDVSTGRTYSQLDGQSNTGLESNRFPEPINVAKLQQQTSATVEAVFTAKRVQLIVSGSSELGGIAGLVGQIEPYSPDFALGAPAYAVITVQQLHEGLIGFLERLRDGVRLVVVRDVYPNDERLAVISDTVRCELTLALSAKPQLASRSTGTSSSGPK